MRTIIWSLCKFPGKKHSTVQLITTSDSGVRDKKLQGGSLSARSAWKK